MYVSNDSHSIDDNFSFQKIKTTIENSVYNLVKTIFESIAEFFSKCRDFFVGSKVEVVKDISRMQCEEEIADQILPKIKIDSSDLVKLDPKFKHRSDFLLPSKNYQSNPPYIFRSHFVPEALAEGLMREKRDVAIATKYLEGTPITNMEALLHSFVVPMCRIKALGDYEYSGGHSMALHGEGKAREMIMSATIHPDFEDDQVMLKLAEITDSAISGEVMSYDRFPSKEEKSNASFRRNYDEKLLKHLVQHLTTNASRISKSQATVFASKAQAIEYLEMAISDPDFDLADLSDKAFKVTYGGDDRLISLDILYHFYAHQFTNEFEFLDSCLESKYTYTLGPPSIFASILSDQEDLSPPHSDSVKILLRLQCLAFKDLSSRREGFGSNLGSFAISNFADSTIVGLYQDVLKNSSVLVGSLDEVINRDDNGHIKDLIDADGNPTTLVDHNCFDGFGQNIETEGSRYILGSKDAAYGNFTDAAHVLRRDRDDLMMQSFVTK